MSYGSLGSLGSRRRRGSTNGVLSGLGAAPSKYWADPRVTAMQGQLNTMLAASGCSTKLGTDGLIGPGTCGALAWAKAKGSLPAAYTTAAADMDAGCKPFTLTAPNCPAAPTAAYPYGLPFPVNVKNDTAYKWQYMLNSELGARGLTTVPEDGVFNAKTCAGFVAFIKSYQADPDSPTPDDTFAQIVVQNQKGIVAACQALMATPAAPPPPAPAPVPVAPTVSATDLMKQQQAMLNTWLVSVGYQPIAVTGVWDGPTCGAGQLMVKTLPDSDARKVALAAVLAKIKPLLGMPCGVTVQPVAPGRPPVAPPSSAQVLQMQKLINAEVLKPGGYRLIPEDGKLSAATCGAASDTASAADIGRIKVSTTLAGLLSHPGLLTACVPFKPWSFPQVAQAPTPTVAARSSSLPPLNRDGECVVNFNQRYAEIGVLQQQLNSVLMANGYKPIPVTNVWDAATCGAMFELGGKFSPRASRDCPHFYSVPLSCPSVTKPTKPVIALPPPPPPVVVAPPPPPPPPPAPVAKKNVLLPIGIAALVGVTALVIAKKKGLIMAGKAAAA
jgi:hypothetical protein